MYWTDAIHDFQNRALPGSWVIMKACLRWALKGWRPVHLLLGTFGLLIVSCIVFLVSRNSSRVVFFPKGDPNQIYVYLKLPVGTNVEYTDSVTQDA